MKKENVDYILYFVMSILIMFFLYLFIFFLQEAVFSVKQVYTIEGCIIRDVDSRRMGKQGKLEMATCDVVDENGDLLAFVYTPYPELFRNRSKIVIASDRRFR